MLEDAGYTVIVPAVVDARGAPAGEDPPEDRCAAEPRAPPRPASGHLSLDTLIAYQYQLSIGGQAVTEQEWRQLVNAKTPLVQFRGQWMELDRDKMRQMLEFWQTQQRDAARDAAAGPAQARRRGRRTTWNGITTAPCGRCWRGCTTRAPSPRSRTRQRCRGRCATTSGAGSPGCTTWRAWA